MKAESVLLTMIPKTHFIQNGTRSLFCGSASDIESILILNFTWDMTNVCFIYAKKGMYRQGYKKQYHQKAYYWNKYHCTFHFSISSIYSTKQESFLHSVRLNTNLQHIWANLCGSTCLHHRSFDCSGGFKEKGLKGPVSSLRWGPFGKP